MFVQEPDTDKSMLLKPTPYIVLRRTPLDTAVVSCGVDVVVEPTLGDWLGNIFVYTVRVVLSMAPINWNVWS